MKKPGILGLCVVLMLVFTLPATARFYPDRPFTVLSEQRIPNVLVIKFAEQAKPVFPRGLSGDAITGLPSVDRINGDFLLQSFVRLFPGARVPPTRAEREDLTGYCVLVFPLDVDLEAAYAAYEADPNIEQVEYDYFATIMRVPNDSYYSTLWALNQTLDHDIDAPEAWDITAGDSSVILADTDTGVLYTHADLADNIWVNPGEDLDGDGVVMDTDDLDYTDNDGNGYEDDFIGYDFVSSGINVWPGEDGSVKDNDPKDYNGHGTHTSGTIAATTNNALGVAGVAGGFGPGTEPGCRIMCLRMGYSFNDGGYENGRTHMSYVAEAFNYATNNGATAINYSFGSSTGGGIEAATNDAIAAGLVIAASAGNGSSSNPSSFGYLQKRSDVLCVAATTSSDKKWGGSNWGPFVDISAPGAAIRSTVSNHYAASYAYYYGTSMAAPHIVGLVGLLKSVNPDLTGQQIKDNILANADNIDALNPSYAGGLGAGRINAFNSVSNAAVADFSATPQIGDAPLMVDFTDLSPQASISWVWDFGDNDTAIVQNPSHEYQAGLYDVSLSITTIYGNGYLLLPDYIMALDEQLGIDTVDGLRNEDVYVEINLDNNVPVSELYLPISATGVPADAYFDSLTASGCRTEYFEYRELVHSSPYTGEHCLYLKADNGGGALPLDPGSGPIARAWFSVHGIATPGNFIQLTVANVGGYDLELSNHVGTFIPDVIPGGGIDIQGIIGDLDLNFSVDPIDVAYLVNQVYKGTPPPLWPPAADCNCDDAVDPLDVAVLVAHVYRQQPAPCSW